MGSNPIFFFSGVDSWVRIPFRPELFSVVNLTAAQVVIKTTIISSYLSPPVEIRHLSYIHSFYSLENEQVTLLIPSKSQRSLDRNFLFLDIKLEISTLLRRLLIE